MKFLENIRALIDVIFDFLSQAEKNICKMNLITYTAQVETYNQTSKQMDTISQTLQKLQDKLVNSKDIKESTDAGNAIQLEVAKKIKSI